MVPAPAPTSPSSNSSAATAKACRTSFSPTARFWIWLIRQSLHSPTTGLMLIGSSPLFWHCSITIPASASQTFPTFNVFVRAIGVSRVPSSSTCTRPALFPNPLWTPGTSVIAFLFPVFTLPGTIPKSRIRFFSTLISSLDFVGYF